MSPIKIIYLKEMREMLRDKRVRTSAFLGPLISVSLILFLFSFLMNAVGSSSNQKIHVVRTENAIVDALRAAKIDVEDVDSLEEGRQMVKDGKARVVLKFDDDFDRRFAANEPTHVLALYNPSQPVSQIALATVRQVIDKANAGFRDALLKAKGISPSQLEPLQLKAEEVRVGNSGVNDLLVGILPYMIVIWAFYGGMALVADLVAGEKEKNTLETLMIAPIRRTDIALGKFFALATLCMSSSLSALIGVYAIAALHLPSMHKLFERGVGVSPVAACVIALVMAPTVALFASMMLAVSAYAKNPRESQGYLALISFLITMPAIASQVVGFTDAGSSLWINFVPVLNTANTIRLAMFGRFDAEGILATAAVSLALAAIALRVAVALFNREQVLTRV